MIQDVAVRLWEFFMLGGAGAFLAALLAAGAYDLRLIARRPKLAAAVRKFRKKSAQPPVTVIVYAHNDAGTVTACLGSLRRSLYRNYDIVVVDNASRDGTRQAVRAFKRKYPGFIFRFYAKTKHCSVDQCLRRAYQKGRKGDVVVVLTASSRPSRSFLSEVAARFSVDPELTGVTFCESTGSPVQVIDIVPTITRATRHMVLKAVSLLGKRHAHVELNGACRSGVVLDGARTMLRYESSLSLTVVPREKQAGALSWQPVRVVLALVMVLLMSYTMIMAAGLVSYMPLLLSWLLVTAGSVAVIWSDESVRVMQKIQLTFAATLLYFLLYIAAVSFLIRQIVKNVAVIFRPVHWYSSWPIRRRAIP